MTPQRRDRLFKQIEEICRSHKLTFKYKRRSRFRRYEYVVFSSDDEDDVFITITIPSKATMSTEVQQAILHHLGEITAHVTIAEVVQAILGKLFGVK